MKPRKKRKPMTQRALKAWEARLLAQEAEMARRERDIEIASSNLDSQIGRHAYGVNRFNQMVEANRATKLRVRVPARSEPRNPLDGERLWS